MNYAVKKIMILLTAFFFCSAFHSDNMCFKYFPESAGTVYEMTNYNAKDKMVSRTEGTVLEAEKTASGFNMKIATKVYDDKEKEMMNGDYTAKCENNTFYLDMSNMLPSEMLTGMQDMEMEMTGGFMEFPSDPEPGQTLHDADMTMKFSSGGTSIMTLTASITDRKVEGFETVTTPAGSFECIKFSETINMKMLFKTTSRSTTWMAPEVGVVKTESYNEKGKLEGYSLLTKFNN